MSVHSAQYYIITFAITIPIDPIKGSAGKKQTDPPTNKKTTTKWTTVIRRNIITSIT